MTAKRPMVMQCCHRVRRRCFVCHDWIPREGWRVVLRVRPSETVQAHEGCLLRAWEHRWNNVPKVPTC